MSLVSSMNIAQQALLVNQAAINVVSNNISNVNTEGYSRQRVNLTPGVNYTPTGYNALDQAYSSSGVDIASIQRYSDTYLQSYFRMQNSNASYLGQYSQVATNIESLTNELQGSGLEEAFTKFFEAAQTLSLNPTDVVARQNYMQQAQTVALKFNDLSADFTEMRSALVGDVAQPGSIENSNIFGMVTEANSLMEQITKVNNDIVLVSCSETPPSSLLDKRDQLIDKLSALLPVTVNDNTNGTTNISINGVDVIKGTEQLFSLNVSPGTDDTPAVIRLQNSAGAIMSTPINDQINTGSIGAVLDVCGVSPDKLTIKGVLNQFDDLAAGFARIINDIQTRSTPTEQAMAIDGATKLLTPALHDIFQSSVPGPITARTIQINSLVMNNPYLVAVAKVDPANFELEAIGNNSNMLDVLNARTQNSAFLSNSSPESTLATIVGKVGLKVADINDNIENQSIILTQAENQLSSAKGVNLDEELIDLTKYQTAYKASSRIYTVCNELLELLINLGR